MIFIFDKICFCCWDPWADDNKFFRKFLERFCVCNRSGKDAFWESNVKSEAFRNCWFWNAFCEMNQVCLLSTSKINFKFSLFYHSRCFVLTFILHLSLFYGTSQWLNSNYLIVLVTVVVLQWNIGCKVWEIHCSQEVKKKMTIGYEVGSAHFIIIFHISFSLQIITIK